MHPFSKEAEFNLFFSSLEVHIEVIRGSWEASDEQKKQQGCFLLKLFWIGAFLLQV